MTAEALGFDEFVATHGDGLLRTAFLLCGDDHRAHDLVQSALEKAFRSWPRVSRANVPVAYVRRIVVREHLSWLRRRSSTELPVESIDVVALTDETAVVDTRDAVWRLLATLPRKQRAVLVLRLFEDLSDDEIADVLGCRPSTVRAHASRALATLRANPNVQRPGRAETSP